VDRDLYLPAGAWGHQVLSSSRTFAANLRRTMSLVWRASPRWAAANAVLVVAQALLPLASLALIRLVVNAVSKAAVDHNVSTGHMLVLVGLSASVALTIVAAGSLGRLAAVAQAQVVGDHLASVLNRKSAAVGLSYYENPSYHDTLHRAQQEGAQRPTQIVSSLLSGAQGAIGLLALGALLLSLGWWLGAALVAAALPGAAVRMRTSRALYVWQRSRTSDERQTWYLNWVLTRDVFAKEVRLYGLGPLLSARYEALRSKLRAERLGYARARARAELMADALSTLAGYALYAIVAVRAAKGSLSLGDLVLYYQAVQRAQASLGQMLGSMSDLYEHNLFLSDLFEFLDLPIEVTQPPQSARSLSRHKRTYGIRFESVGYRYPGSEHDVLRGVDLTIAPREHVALVGANGAGKTTLIKLMCRLYDPTEGRISIDGHDLRELSLQELRTRIAVVFQDFCCYQLTALENVWLGDVTRPPDRERARDAAAAAGAARLIDGLPNGYDTQLGRWFAEGTELSTGEWQKIALARAFYRDAPIVVLDEPTSAQDSPSEFRLFERFHQLARGRTAVFVSHRASTVQMADTIHVLEEGRITQSGSHSHLAGQQGHYSRLFQAPSTALALNTALEAR
jgi:ATP-binding cassette, subfamily B, bacterial